GVGFRLGFHTLHASRRLEAADASHRQRAGEPVAGGKRGAVVEDRGNRHHHRQPQMAAGDHLGGGPERTADLSLDRRLVAHLTRSAPVTKSHTSSSRDSSSMGSSSTGTVVVVGAWGGSSTT